MTLLPAGTASTARFFPIPLKGIHPPRRKRNMIHAAEMEVVVGADPEEFAAVVADHRTRLFGFLLQMVGNREDAMDLLQEGFLKLHTKWHLRDPDRPLAPWSVGSSDRGSRRSPFADRWDSRLSSYRGQPQHFTT